MNSLVESSAEALLTRPCIKTYNYAQIISESALVLRNRRLLLYESRYVRNRTESQFLHSLKKK